MPVRPPLGRAFPVFMTMLGLSLVGCKSQTKDAATLGKSGNQMATDTAAYFNNLADGTKNFPYVTSLINNGSPLPTKEEVTHAQTESNEYRLRANVYTKLAAAYKSLEDLANGQPTDTEKSVSGLESAVVKLNSGHGFNITAGGVGIPQSVIDTAVTKITDALFDLRKQKDLRKGNADLLAVDEALLALFKSEESIYYETDAKAFYQKEYQLAEVMADKGNIDAHLSNYIQDTNASVLSSANVQWAGPIMHQQLEDEQQQTQDKFVQQDKDIEKAIQGQIDLHVKFQNHQPLAQLAQK